MNLDQVRFCNIKFLQNMGLNDPFLSFFIYKASLNIR